MKEPTLYDVFRNEQNRVGDIFKVSYNEEKNILQYTNDEGVLTVAFNPPLPDGRRTEKLYYHYFNPAPDYPKDVMEYGFPMAETYGLKSNQGGCVGKWDRRAEDAPQEACDVAGNWLFDRELLGIEAKKPKQLDREF